MQKFGKICSNIIIVDIPSINSWIDSITSPKVKQKDKELSHIP
jgi:hypothetical protein